MEIYDNPDFQGLGYSGAELFHFQLEPSTTVEVSMVRTNDPRHILGENYRQYVIYVEMIGGTRFLEFHACEGGAVYRYLSGKTDKDFVDCEPRYTLLDMILGQSKNLMELIQKAVSYAYTRGFQDGKEDIQGDLRNLLGL
jgi:hypothetical protein